MGRFSTKGVRESSAPLSIRRRPLNWSNGRSRKAAVSLDLRVPTPKPRSACLALRGFFVGWVERTRETHRTLARHTVGLTSTFDPPYTLLPALRRIGVDPRRFRFLDRLDQVGAGYQNLEVNDALLARLHIDPKDAVGVRRQFLNRIEDERLALRMGVYRTLHVLEVFLVRHDGYELDVRFRLRASVGDADF